MCCYFWGYFCPHRASGKITHFSAWEVHIHSVPRGASAPVNALHTGGDTDSDLQPSLLGRSRRGVQEGGWGGYEAEAVSQPLSPLGQNPEKARPIPCFGTWMGRSCGQARGWQTPAFSHPPADLGSRQVTPQSLLPSFCSWGLAGSGDPSAG